MPAPEIIKELVERFERDLESYRSGAYKEAHLRQEFLNPFFETLGWDMQNKSGKSFHEREVIHEDSLEIEHEIKAPDYSFWAGKERKFFVEAKKPSVNIEISIDPAYQLRSYAWSGTLPLSILTDFEEFSVYDCRFEPKYGDKASVARVTSISFREYLERWDEIASVFSREAVLNGSFDKYAEEVKSKKGTVRIDEAILAEIEKWRDLLARNIAVREPDLSVGQLNYAVQATIDRIIFLRICEDRRIEPYGQLRAIGEEKNIYAGLTQLFQKADAKYNSGLFHFRDEKEQSSYPDSFTLKLKVDDKVLKEILTNLYFPKSPYKFKEIPSDILGKIYEQFLGKVIRLTASHQAKMEVKPEVKKAGGVFYTPTFIVNYIVANTVGRIVNPTYTPKEAAKLRIIDPACGSGTFLLGAYQYLLDWHLNWYVANDPEKWATGKKPALYLSKDGYRLTGAKKKEILLNNIYGVDIDAQAVEVTKLSLLLKVLEDESNETIGSQLALFQERVLPDLGKNIKCGNSLIGHDYWEGQLGDGEWLMDNGEERAKVNAFDWQAAFPEVFATEGRGGFDAVIGNPPYVRQEMLGENFKIYAQKKYTTFSGTADLYVYFIEFSYNVLRPNGVFSFIVANKWMRANYGEPLRKWLKDKNIEEIVDFGDLPVFQSATTYPCVLRLSKKSATTSLKVVQVKTLDFQDLNQYVEDNQYEVEQSSLSDSGWSLVNKGKQELIEKLQSVSVPLSKYVNGRIFYGIKTGLNEAFVIDKITKEALIKEHFSSQELIKPFLAGRDIKRFEFVNNERFVIFTRHGVDIKKYPAIHKYLLQFKEQLMPKPKNWKGSEWKGRKPGSYEWYEIQDTVDYFLEFEKPKIIVPAIVQRASYAFDRNGFYSNDKTSIIGVDDLYLLGILNSKIPDFIMHLISSTKQGGYFEYKPMYLSQLPIRPINFVDPADKACHDKMVFLVERMLELHKRNPRTPQEKESLAGEIESTDKSIDGLVYQLYGLSPEEINIVEGKA